MSTTDPPPFVQHFRNTLNYIRIQQREVEAKPLWQAIELETAMRKLDSA